MHIALQAQACDSLVLQQEKEINRSIKVEQAQDSLLAIKDKTIAIQGQVISTQDERFANQVALTSIEKKKKWKWIWVSGGLLALVIFTNFP